MSQKNRDLYKTTPPASVPAAAPEADLQAQVQAARQARVQACEREVQQALAPILERHNCRLATRQVIIDGQPQPVQIVVAAND